MPRFLSRLGVPQAFVLLAATHQSVVHVFTSNSKVAVAFEAAHPQAKVFANTNPLRAATFHNLVRPGDPKVRILPIAELTAAGNVARVDASN